MAPPKKNVKMDLGSFLADDTLGGGSWADEDVDISSIAVSIGNTSTSGGSQSHYGSGSSGFGGGHASSNTEGGFQEQRREHVEYPIPDAPPYRARIGNLPYEVTEAGLSRFLEDRLQAPGSVEDLKLPMDQMSGRPKGFAFVTLAARELLEEALDISGVEFNGRKIYLSVAAPQKQDVFDMDWRGGRSSGTSGSSRRDRAEEVELDWGSARGSHTLPPRERSNRGGERMERRPRRDEPEFDWGSARNTQATLPPRERSNRGQFGGGERVEREPRTPREEPNLDWGSARNTQASLPPRERSNRGQFGGERKPKKDEPEFDWGAARSTQASLPPRERSNRTPRTTNSTPKKQDDSLDWGKRGQALPPKQQQQKTTNNVNKTQQDSEKKEKKDKPTHSFGVLSIEGDEDEEEEQQQQDQQQHIEKNASEGEKKLESATANLSIEDSNDGEWEVVRK